MIIFLKINFKGFFLFTGFTKGAEERADHGSDVDWYPCAHRRSDWWPVHVF